jgi:hypothetical protein
MGRKKRSLESTESDLSRVSPPYKMPSRSSRSGSCDRTSEILAEIAGLRDQFGKLEKEVAEISKFVREVETLRSKVAEISETCESFQRLELENKKRCVLLRGIRFGTQAKFETRQQTKAVLAEFFEKLDFAPHLVDYQRLGGLKPDGNGSKISIRVQFADVDQKFDLFDRLKGRGRELNEVSVLTDYPSFQLTQFKQLSGVAYRLRQENPGTRTRIVPRGLGLVLQKKGSEPDAPWTPVSA